MRLVYIYLAALFLTSGAYAQSAADKELIRSYFVNEAGLANGIILAVDPDAEGGASDTARAVAQVITDSCELKMDFSGQVERYIFGGKECLVPSQFAEQFNRTKFGGTGSFVVQSEVKDQGLIDLTGRKSLSKRINWVYEENLSKQFRYQSAMQSGQKLKDNKASRYESQFELLGFLDQHDESVLTHINGSLALKIDRKNFDIVVRMSPEANFCSINNRSTDCEELLGLLSGNEYLQKVLTHFNYKG
jgi:hypothetical protein